MGDDLEENWVVDDEISLKKSTFNPPAEKKRKVTENLDQGPKKSASNGNKKLKSETQVPSESQSQKPPTMQKSQQKQLGIWTRTVPFKHR